MSINEIVTAITEFTRAHEVWAIPIGPLLAVFPLVAGICEMRQRHFQIANFASAMIWAFGILAPGALGLRWFAIWMG